MKYAKGERAERKKEPGLTNKQKLFVAEYKKDCNGARAAAAAGYSHPKDSAGALLDESKYPLVAAEVRSMEQAKSRQAGVDAAWVVKRLSKIAGVNVQDLLDPTTGEYLPVHKLPKEVAYAISEVEMGLRMVPDGKGGMKPKTYIRSVKLNSKLEALKQLGQHLGKLVDHITNVQNNTVVFSWDALLSQLGKVPDDDPIETTIEEAGR